jgi:2-succinyl-6-hydroxy-2,4-cyclohexadiene-1-carboxylate synthase
MGARVGLGLLLGYKHLFTGATLVGVHPGLVEAADRQRRAALEEAHAQSLENDGVLAFVDYWERIPLFASQQELPSAILSLQREQRLSLTAAGLALALRSLGLAGMPAYRTRLPSLDLPIQLVVGEKDKKFGQIAEGMTALLPRAELLRIAGVGHNVVLEAPRELAEVVIRNFVPEAASSNR